MNTFITIILAGVVSLCVARAAEEKTAGEKTAEVWDETKKKTKEVGHAVAEKTKEAVQAVENAVTQPDPDAHKVVVKLSEHSIEMPRNLEAGKTAFTVTNAGKEKHNFEIKGKKLEKSFFLSLAPNDTKVMQVDLKPGTYKVYCPLEDHEDKGMKVRLTVE